MDDMHTSVQDLKEAVKAFIKERDWEKYHSPKNIAMSIAIEAGELMEHFQWLSQEESNEISHNEEAYNEIRYELADITMFVLDFAMTLDIDLSSAVKDKLSENRQKYPVELCKGKHTKYTKLRTEERNG